MSSDLGKQDWCRNERLASLDPAHGSDPYANPLTLVQRRTRCPQDEPFAKPQGLVHSDDTSWPMHDMKLPDKHRTQNPRAHPIWVG